MSKANPGRQALNWLHTRNPGPAADLMRQARDLTRLQADIDAWAAVGKLKLQAGPVKDGALKLFTDHPAMLARARQQLPSLLARLNERGWRLDRIDLKVRSRPTETPQLSRPKRGQFGSKAGASWVDLVDKLQDERLREATRRLCERNGWNADQAKAQSD